MKVTLAGVPGSGKSTVRKKLAERYQLDIKGTGDFMRQVAQRYGYNDITRFLVEYVSNHPEIDHEVDQEQKKYGEEHNHFVLDAHLGFHFVPDSIKIFLRCDLEVAAQRILDAKRSTEEASTFEETLTAMKRRIQTMKGNFQKLYGIDFHAAENFDFVVDTSHLNPDQVFEKISHYLDSLPQ